MNLTDFLHQTHLRLEPLLDQSIHSLAPPLRRAMAYATLNGGKRVRPTLVYLTGNALDAQWESLDPAAIAIEFIHVYSLIHDDLPSMDNADLRRGQPSCHKAFDEATAILAGDALQPLAFDVLGNYPSPLSAEQRIRMIGILSEEMQKMVAGQMLDISGVDSLATLNHMYQLKTGSLLKASVLMGAVASNLTDTNCLKSLSLFAENIGLAFQIQDDLLDVEGSTQLIGKPQGTDQANHKITYPALLGMEKSRQQTHELFETALSALDFLGDKKNLLAEFAKQLMQRKK